ncbi:hypothetical protein SEA_SHAGRAT_112 [Rhodococcus phage Shagrat]|nr:hypothetical protein SEA_SHAGRAT_112 [Rhodococcus phage Shagrat]
MRDYLAGFVFGATAVAGIVFGGFTADATPETYGNFNPSVSIDANRVSVTRECQIPIYEDDPIWDCRTNGNGICGE